MEVFPSDWKYIGFNSVLVTSGSLLFRRIISPSFRLALSSQSTAAITLNRESSFPIFDNFSQNTFKKNDPFIGGNNVRSNELLITKKFASSGISKPSPLPSVCIPSIWARLVDSDAWNN